MPNPITVSNCEEEYVIDINNVCEHCVYPLATTRSTQTHNNAILQALRTAFCNEKITFNGVDVEPVINAEGGFTWNILHNDLDTDTVVRFKEIDANGDFVYQNFDIKNNVELGTFTLPGRFKVKSTDGSVRVTLADNEYDLEVDITSYCLNTLNFAPANVMQPTNAEVMAFLTANNLSVKDGTQVVYFAPNHDGSCEYPDFVWSIHNGALIQTSNKVLTVANYAELRALDNYRHDIVNVETFTYTYEGKEYTTIGGAFERVHDENITENGGFHIVSANGTQWKRVEYNGIDVYPDWWEVGGYDNNGELPESQTYKGIRNDFDRIYSANESGHHNIHLPHNRVYVQDYPINLKEGVTLYGNNATIKRKFVQTTLTAPTAVGATTYEVADANSFVIGMAIIGVSGVNVGDTDLNTPSSYHTITSIDGNTITFSNPANKPLPIGSKILQTMTQIGYSKNVTINRLNFDGNKDEMNGTVSWNHNNCLKNTTYTGLVVNYCTFKNMPSDCITTAGESWINGCRFENLNACALHGSSGTGNDYTQTGTWFKDCKFLNICLTTASANGHTSQHGVYVQSIGTRGVKFDNCRIENVVHGGVFSPLTSQSDEFSLINSYVKNASHLTTNIGTLGITDLNISNNNIINTNLSPLGGGSTSTAVYKKLLFTNNIILNSIFHFSGVTDGIFSNNTFKLSNEYGQVDFSNTELTKIGADYVGILHVVGRNNKISNNLFVSEYDDPIWKTAISFGFNGGQNTNQKLDITDNHISDFTTGIRSINGTTATVMRGVNITNNFIKVRDGVTGYGIFTYANATIKGNTIENTNLSESIRVYGNLQNPCVDIGCKVVDNFIYGTNYGGMINVFYFNNIIEGNILEGGIGYQNATYKANNIVGNNRQFNRTTRKFATNEVDAYVVNGVQVSGNAASITKIQVGRYRITHNLNDANAVVTCNLDEPFATRDSVAIHVVKDSRTANSVDIMIHEGDNGTNANVLRDRDFDVKIKSVK